MPKGCQLLRDAAASLRKAGVPEHIIAGSTSDVIDYLLTTIIDFKSESVIRLTMVRENLATCLDEVSDLTDEDPSFVKLEKSLASVQVDIDTLLKDATAQLSLKPLPLQNSKRYFKLTLVETQKDEKIKTIWARDVSVYSDEGQRITKIFPSTVP
jgi:hypothetical protein